MLNLWISRRQDELLTGTATLDAGILLVDMVLPLVAASASLVVKRMSAMRGDISAGSFHGTAMM